ncbi:type II toxin-antitoxin system RelE family toxin [Paenibacillus campi]|uniref:type II toxin-antitoxin system RelE family toxin n=1 Tax=Paenibacillus campi TaxID=3106031 RepID=UPI002AFDD3BF|nr:type II toxin-antitoxin system RelE/ParE family toxin [Paenibacillus sp. SGZ-1014]
MDRHQAVLLIGWIENNVINFHNMRAYGKALLANHNHKGKWRYRIGAYRILTLIEDGEISITIIDVGHRQDGYE